MVQLLTSQADASVRIRILLGDPDAPEVAQRGEDERIGDSVSARIRNALALLKPLLSCDAVELRHHRTILYNSIFRADDRLLANPHIYGTPAAAAPVLHLHRSANSALFTTYADSFEQAWRS